MATKEKMQKRYESLTKGGIRKAAESLQRRASGTPMTEDEIADQKMRVKGRTATAGKDSTKKTADALKASIARETAARTGDSQAHRLANSISSELRRRRNGTPYSERGQFIARQSKVNQQRKAEREAEQGPRERLNKKQSELEKRLRKSK